VHQLCALFLVKQVRHTIVGRCIVMFIVNRSPYSQLPELVSQIGGKNLNVFVLKLRNY